MAEMELGYWKIRGLAAAIRMMLYYKQQTFKEVAYSSEDADAEWFGKDKPELKKKNSMINLPYLIDDDEVITQSNSILLYQCGLTSSPAGPHCGRGANEARPQGQVRERLPSRCDRIAPFWLRYFEEVMISGNKPTARHGLSADTTGDMLVSLS